MSDQLERFIQHHRAEFDQAIPSLKVWADIDKQLAGSKKNHLRRSSLSILSMAASIAILLALGAAGGLYFSKTNLADDDILAAQYPAYQEVQQQYAQQVNSKMEQLKQYNFESIVSEDMRQLDFFLTDLKKQLEKAPLGSEEEIIQAMIQNYQTKLAILERVLERIQPLMRKEQNVKKYETIDI